MPLLLLMGIGPLIAWRRRALSARLLQDAALADRGGARHRHRAADPRAPARRGPGSSPTRFCAFVLATIVVELVRGTRVTGSLFELVSRNRRRYGGYVVHASIVLLAIGIVGSSAYSSEKDVPAAARASRSRSPATRSPSTASSASNELERERDPRRARRQRPLRTARSGRGINNYFNGDTSREVGIHTSWLRARGHST